MKTLLEFWRYREVILQLAFREVRVHYKQTLLGVVWAIIPPVALMMVFTILFTKVSPIATEGYPYPIYVFAGLLPWQLFNKGMTRATVAITGNANLIQKIYVPRTSFLLSSCSPPIVDFALAMLVYFGLMAWFKVPPTWHILWVLPLFVLQMLLIYGLGLWTSTLNAFYRDAANAIGVFLQIWFYALPIIYPLTKVPDRWMPYYRLNPMVGILEGFRGALLRGEAPDATLIGISIIVTVGAIVTGHALFRKAEWYFADVL